MATYPLIAMRSYFDGSEGEDGSGHKWLTLAGYIAKDSVWASFEPKWKEMLRNRYPPAPWLHMSQMMNHEDPFERVNGWTDEKLGYLIVDALKLLQRLDKKAFRMFVCSVDVTAREYLSADGYDIPDASIICAQTCFRGSLNWYLASSNPLEAAYVYYDQGEPFFESIRQYWKTQKHPTRVVLAGDIWGLIAIIEEADMRYTPPIQAADLAAWGHSRELVHRDRAWRYLAEIARKIIPSSVFRVDEDYLRHRYSRAALK